MEKCINCDGYDWTLGKCNIEEIKWCEKPVEIKVDKKKSERIKIED